MEKVELGSSTEAAASLKEQVFILEDEPDIADLIALHLRKNGYAASSFERAQALLSTLSQGLPSLLILDLMLPDADGLELLAHLRKSARTARLPVIILTARGDEPDRIVGLELGADDYLPKPFSPRELVARVKAVLRRLKRPATPESDLLTLHPHLQLDTHRMEAEIEGARVQLTATEFRILHLFAQRPGWFFSREQILEHLWHGEKAVVDRSVDVHIKRLRDKLGKAGKLLESKRGVGYRLQG